VKREKKSQVAKASPPVAVSVPRTATISSSYNKIDRVNSEAVQAFYTYAPPYHAPSPSFHQQQEYYQQCNNAYFQHYLYPQYFIHAGEDTYGNISSESSCSDDSVPSTVSTVHSNTTWSSEFTTSFDSMDEAEIWKDVLDFYCGSMDETNC
jgi:hypothetical protein